MTSTAPASRASFAFSSVEVVASTSPPRLRAICTTSEPVPPVDPRRLQAGGSLFLTRPTLAHYIADREELLERSAAVFDALLDGSLRVRIGGRYALDEVGQAHTDLESRRTTGKLLVIP